MELGLKGKTAIVCASTQGIGRACADALAAEGVDVVINGRTEDRVRQAVEEIRAATGVRVRGVAADITTADGRARLLEACPEPDILVTNNAGPTPGRIDQVTDDDLEDALLSHYLTPIRLMRSVVDGMAARKFGRIVNLASAMVATPRPTMVASAGARTGMTAVMKAVSLQYAPHNVLINQILSERIDTARQHQMAQIEAERLGLTYADARARQAASIAVGRHGRPEEVGAACAFLCAASFGYITGTSLRLDGGANPGLL